MSLSKQQILKKVGERIKDLRDKVDISQEELAERAKIHRNYLGRIERGESNPPVFTIYRIAIALKTNPAELLKV